MHDLQNLHDLHDLHDPYDPDRTTRESPVLSSTRPTRRAAARTLQATAGVAAIALALTACGGSDEPEGGSGDDGPITLKVATFNDFGYTEELLAEYTEEHPNVTVEPITAATSDDARSNLTTKLAAGGEGLADIEAIEVDWLPELMQYPDLFTDLADPELDGRWVDWKVQRPPRPRARSSATAPTSAPRPSATAPTCSRRPACRPTARRSPSSSAATTRRGRTTSPQAVTS